MLPYVDAVIPGVPEAAAEVLQDWETDIYGLAIILVMLFMPGGVAGALRRISSRRGSAETAGLAEGGDAG